MTKEEFMDIAARLYDEWTLRNVEESEMEISQFSGDIYGLEDIPTIEEGDYVEPDIFEPTPEEEEAPAEAEDPVEEEPKLITPMKFRKSTEKVQVGNMAKHYGITSQDVRNICDVLGVPVAQDKYLCIMKGDAMFVVSYITRKYNNFNIV